MAKSQTRARKATPLPEIETIEEQLVNEMPEEIPLLPIRDAVYFPHMVFPLFVGREKSVRALDEAMAQQRFILLVAQKQVTTDDPEPEDIYSVGLVAEVMQIMKVPDGTVRVVLEGIERVRVVSYKQTDPYFLAKVEPMPSLEESMKIPLVGRLKNENHK